MIKSLDIKAKPDLDIIVRIASLAYVEALYTLCRRSQPVGTRSVMDTKTPVEHRGKGALTYLSPKSIMSYSGRYSPIPELPRQK